MKKNSISRILVLVLSLALLIGAVFCITAAASEPTAGEFGSVSVAYGDKVAIRVEVEATEEQLKNGDVVVSYTIGGKSANAEYYMTDDKGRVWVITEGIAAYNLAEVVTFSSTAGGTAVESDRTYSVAQFICTMLYTESDLDEKYVALYESLLAYGKAAQLALGINTDSLVTDSTIVYTDNTDVALNGGTTVFAPAASVNVTPTYKAALPVGKELVGWNIIDNGEAKAAELSFKCSGAVEVVSPILADMDPTPFTLVNGGFENGLEGWTLVGNIGDVSTDTHYWVGDPESAEGFAFGMDGENMFSAYAPGALESAVGTLTSSTFTVGGSGFVTFKIGAMKNANEVYVDVVDAETKEILARYYNGLWAEKTDNVKSGCTLVAYKADLSAFMGKSVFFRISDNAKSDYGLFFLDSFNTYYTSEPGGFATATPVGYGVSGTIYDLFNGGFEQGGTQGWWNDGEPGAVTGADKFFNGREYGKVGSFLYSGVEDEGAGNGREGNKGTLTSSVFELGGNGYISFMLGGGNAFCYVQVIDSTTGEVLARYRQQARDEAVLVKYVADLSAYVGRSLRIQLVDNASSDWGCVSFDNIVTYNVAVPEGTAAVDVKHELINGSFEDGLNGWYMDITEAGAQNTLGWVESTEHDAEWYTKNDDRKDGNSLFTFVKPDGTNCENTKGTLNSTVFTLEQNSYVSFRFGGAGTRDVHVQLCKANGEVIATFYNEAEGKVNTEMYAYTYQYTGETTDCYFRVVDNSTSNYGCFVVDDFRVNLEAKPEGYLDAIQ